MLTPEFRSLSPDNGRATLFSRILAWFDSYAIPEYPPELTDLPDITMTEDVIKRIPLSDWHAYVSDDDTPIDSLQWQVSGNDHIVARFENDTLVLTPETNYFGCDTIVISVDDGQFSDQDTLTIIVAPVNDAPGNFNLIWPPDLADIPDTSSLMLSWEPSEDVDDDTLYYRVHLYSDHVDSSIILMNATNLPLEDLCFFSPDTVIHWSVTAVDPDDSSVTALNAPLTFTLTYVEVALSEILPEKFVLMPCYPNPFNPRTTITYGLPKESFVKISIFDLNGKRVESIVNEAKAPGFHRVSWNATGMPSGIYIIAIHAEEFVNTQKVALLK
jgi:hypothetical protein